jgi:hypothetical protein
MIQLKKLLFEIQDIELKQIIKQIEMNLNILHLEIMDEYTS